MTDIEIARNTELKNIKEIAENLGLIEDDLDLYGKYKAKISEDALERIHKNGETNWVNKYPVGMAAEEHKPYGDDNG